MLFSVIFLQLQLVHSTTTNAANNNMQLENPANSSSLVNALTTNDANESSNTAEVTTIEGESESNNKVNTENQCDESTMDFSKDEDLISGQIYGAALSWTCNII